MQCVNCLRELPDCSAFRFCSYCELSPNHLHKKGKLSALESLEICPEANWNALRYKVFRWNAGTSLVELEVLKYYFSQLSTTKQQVLIRRFNLDGRGTRLQNHIAQEVGCSITVVSRAYHLAILQLRHLSHKGTYEELSFDL